MGFWDKVKGAVQAVTGGGAVVKLEADEATLGSPLSVQIHAKANADIDFSNVYLELRAVEYAEVRDVDYDHGDGRQYIEYIEGKHESFRQRFEVANAGTLSDGESNSWCVEIVIPNTANPTFEGEMISHKWLILAGLDAYGNDPDSGWHPLTVWDA